MSDQDRWKKEVDRVVSRTAIKISKAMDSMEADLPEDTAPQMAIELVVKELAERQP